MKNLKPLLGACLSDVYSADEIITGMQPLLGSLTHLIRSHCYHEDPLRNDLIVKPPLKQVDSIALALFD